MFAPSMRRPVFPSTPTLSAIEMPGGAYRRRGVCTGTPQPEENMAQLKESGAALEVQCLTKAYGRFMVFEELSFSIAAGEAVALIGANGSGKSTLLRACLGLVPIDSGAVFVNQQPIHELRGTKLRTCRAGLGCVFQKHNLVPQLSVLTNVLHGALARGLGARVWGQSFAPAQERQKAMACLEEVGLADLAGRRADCLSGGQSQRVAIARALMQDPACLFADEPVASLDPVAGKRIMELFRRLNRSRGITLLFVSHHVDHALDYADRILALRNGRLERDAPAVTQSHESLKDLYAA